MTNVNNVIVDRAIYIIKIFTNSDKHFKKTKKFNLSNIIINRFKDKKDDKNNIIINKTFKKIKKNEKRK